MQMADVHRMVLRHGFKVAFLCGHTSDNLLAAQDMERRKAHDATELRDLSRQMYLTKREQQKLDELRDKIEDEERLFAVRPHLSTHFITRYYYPL